MNLRPMEERDNLAVAQLIRTSLEEFGLDKPGTVYFDSHLDHLADFYQHQEKAAYFVLEDEGHLVGCGGFAPVSDKIAELQKLYVAKNSRGKGYSSRLIKQIVQNVRLAGYEQLYLETSTELATAVVVYQHYGFKPLQQPLSNATGHPAMNIWMIKSLLSDE
ncbi:GNAT family N-acetyltransferase [Streptococcus oralis]|uniref:GNAT family N-acetyltransferase n=1 Tax=Streptococcus oralis TaxID=1303 RepID=A0A4Q2FP65_STROR|nr:GNAT family N-acetyltransferase [Streptococcus oralis]RXX22130.1 GNAT family N-acetyltransferase [Streptococcus oralis]